MLRSFLSTVRTSLKSGSCPFVAAWGEPSSRPRAGGEQRGGWLSLYLASRASRLARSWPFTPARRGTHPSRTGNLCSDSDARRSSVVQVFRTTGAVSRGFSTWLSAARQSVCTATVAKAKRRVLDLTYIRVLPLWLEVRLSLGCLCAGWRLFPRPPFRRRCPSNDGRRRRL